MAATDVFQISSSPPRQFKNYSLISSSPPLPEMSAKNRPQALRSGTQAAPIPQNATASFTSAATLFKSHSLSANIELIDAVNLDVTKEQGQDLPLKNKPSKSKAAKESSQDKPKDGEVAKKRTKKTTKAENITDGDEPEKKVRKPRKKKPDDSMEDADPPARKPRGKATKKATDEVELTKENPPRKTNQTSDKNAQTKLSQGKVTKASTKLLVASKYTFSEERQSLNQNKPSISDDPFAGSIGFGLDEAVKRRTNWTPPSVKFTIEENFPTGGSTDCQEANELEEKKGFTDLFGTYGLAKINAPTRLSKNLEVIDTRKRKLIELVSTKASNTVVLSPKKATTAKKAKTITDQATSAYVNPDDDSLQPGQLLQYFSPQPSETAPSDGFKLPPKPKGRSKSAVKKKQPPKKEYILLSPQSALKDVKNQDFVFGTSSQLAREESPTLLRDLQEAMQASNEIDDPFIDLDDFEDPLEEQSKTLHGKSMWGAAARDDGVNVAEKITLQHDVDKSSRRYATITTDLKPIETMIKNDLQNGPSSTDSVDDLVLKERSASKVSKPPSKVVESADIEMPNFESYTTAQLAKEIASYRFKPIKSRAQMITLLEKCWEGKHRPALSILGSNTIIKPSKPVSEQKETSPKRPRGRPRKDTSTTTTPSPKRKPKSKELVKHDTLEDQEMTMHSPLSQRRTSIGLKSPSKLVEDISDSEAEHTPSPRRRRGSRSKISPLKLKSSIDTDIDNMASSQQLMFQHITRAVKAAPRAKDSINPSWHEKILLYDPIILEDLTVWLNTGALQKAGWDGEVDPKTVKKWCESKSICCLWRENLRGGARNRY